MFGGVGWADVIILGAVGAWNGWSFSLRTALRTALIGAALAVIAWRRGSRAFPYFPAIALDAFVASLAG
jgi:Flp pilus assembly protein protease CpaA